MLHDKLKQQITEHLGDNPGMTPQLISLFETIGAAYSSADEQIAKLKWEISGNSESLKEWKQKSSAANEIFEQALLRLNAILKKLSNNQDQFDRGQSDPADKLISLISEFENAVRSYTEKTEINAKKIIELENINKELDQFAYIVSHDLKAPLRAIANLSQWIEDDISHLLNTDGKENFILLRNRVYRMESLINAILTYSKSTKMKIKTELSDTGWLISEVIDSLNCPDHITINVNGKFPVIETESVKLQQVFANLIGNSIKYNDKKAGKIEIGFFETEDFCQFYVQDNGPGIEPQYQNKVFMIFQTLEARDDIESTGIGLAIVKKIIEEKGGKIWIESEKGKGARFVFLWPKIKNEILINI